MSEWHDLCAVDDIEHESAREFHIDGQPVVVVRYDGQFHGYLNWCPHLGIELNFMPDQFFDDDRRFINCVNHGALFEPSSGECLAGPCSGDHLIPVPIQVLDGRVLAGQIEPPE